ncbi:MAG: NAD(P)-dependent oxidoreductase [Promethearchaeota archaeon]
MKVGNTKEINVLFIIDASTALKEYLADNLRSLSQVNLIFPEEISEEKFLELAPTADIIVGWRPTKELLLSAERLTLFINPGAGVQHLIDLFREVNNSRSTPFLLANGHGNSYFTATHVVALLLSLASKIIPHHNWMVEGQWRMRDDKARSIPLRDRRIGLLGYGAINQKVHAFLAGFDVEFSILRRSWDEKSESLPTPASKYTIKELHSFLKEIDTLIIAVPLTSLTIGMIQLKELQLLGSEGLLVTVARGPVIDEDALFKALNERFIAGAAIDVWYEYQPEPDEDGRKYPYSKPFHTLPNVVLSPHRGASPLDDLRRWDEVIENITQFATSKNNFINIVNLDLEY